MLSPNSASGSTLNESKPQSSSIHHQMNAQANAVRRTIGSSEARIRQPLRLVQRAVAQ